MLTSGDHQNATPCAQAQVTQEMLNAAMNSALGVDFRSDDKAKATKAAMKRFQK